MLESNKCTDARPCVSPDPHTADPAAVDAGARCAPASPLRKRGRPRIHPPRDPDAPRRPRGRPKGSLNRCKGDRPGRPSRAPGITINDHHVPWSFIKLVYKRLHCDWDDTIDAFWKARQVSGSNAIQRYIMAGFKPGRYGRPWILEPSLERESGKMEKLREWWIQLYRPSRPVRATDPVAPDVAAMLQSLADGMSF